MDLNQQGDKPVIEAQPGPQKEFQRCTADIAIIGGAAFGGKFQPLTSVIHTPFGKKLMGDIEVGDQITNPVTGGVTRVIAVWPQGEQDVYRIVMEDGATACAGGEHLWSYIPDSHRSHRPGTKPAAYQNSILCDNQEYSRWHYLRVCNTKRLIGEMDNSRPRLPLTAPIQYTVPSRNEFVDPYWVGIMLGDGHCGHNYCITNPEPEIIKYLLSLGYTKTGDMDFYLSGEKRIVIRDWCEKHGLEGKLSYNKFVPPYIFYLGVDDRLAVVQGLMDTDGYAGKNGACIYTTTSERLAKDMQRLVWSLGGKASILTKKPEYTYLGEKKLGRLAYNVRVRISNAKNLFRLKRKQDRVRGEWRNGNEMSRRIESIELIGRAESQCITVDNPYGLYLTDDYIVTHNSYALLMEPLRAINDPNFTAIYFRRETPELTAGGGPWETARKMYQRCSRVKFNSTEHTCRWASGAMMKFSHLQLESDIYAHHSAAYAYIAFDELVTFTARQFWYLMTRNRPADGYSGKCWIRAGTNPDADSWLREVIDWWIGPDGYPIMERSGVVRYMTMKDNRVVWVDKGWTDEAGNGPKSFTFIPAPIETNVIGNATQPDYISSLYTQDDVTRERLLRGNWNITYRGGMFKPDWFRFVDKAPEGLKLVRYWDLAATPKKEDETRDPDYSVGVLVGELDGNIYICDIERLQGSPAEVETRIKRCADIDGRAVTVGIEEEKGSSGKYVGSYFARHVLPDRDVISDSISGDKIERAKPWAADAENGRVFLVRADWNRAFLAEAGSFPIGAHKDQCDAVSGGYKLLKIRKKVWPMFNVEDQSMCRKLNLVWTDFVHYGAVSLAQDMTVYVMAAVYMKAVNKLYVYGELKASNVTLDTIAKRIVRGMSLKDKPVHMLFGEDQMFSESTKNIGTTLNLEMKAVCKLEKTRYSAAITPADNYDLHGAHHVTGLMIARKEIVFSEDCQETVRQVMSWSINDKGVPQEGFNLCKCLNMITSAVNKARKQAAKKKPLDPHYRPIRPKENPRKKMDSFQIA